ncbi:MAG: hypothetical protein V4485_06380 [Pseudomonadota bacterium]
MPEVHSVVLYKQVIDIDKDGYTNFQIFVVDPSNSEFSKHLDHHVIEAFVSVSCAAITDNRWVDIITPQKPLQIYTIPENHPHGPDANQFRDCVDIAIKIAFGLNSMTETPKVSFSLEKLASDTIYVSELSVVQVVTNNSDVNKNLTGKHKVLPLREKQSTDRDGARVLYDLETKIQAQKDYLKSAKIEEGKQKAVSVEHDAILQKFADVPHDKLCEFIDALKKFINDNIATFAPPQHHPFVSEALTMSNDTQLSGANHDDA